MENETKHIVKLDDDTEITIKIPQHLTKKTLKAVLDKVERISDIIAVTDAEIYPEKQAEIKKDTKKYFKKMFNPKPHKLFSDEICDYIRERVKAGDSIPSIARMLKFRFKLDVTTKQVYDKIHNMKSRKELEKKPSKRHRTGKPVFTKDMCLLVNKWKNEGSSNKAIANMMNSIYDTKITETQVEDKIYNMKYAKTWTEKTEEPQQPQEPKLDFSDYIPPPPDPKPEEKAQQPQQPQPKEEEPSSSSSMLREIFGLKKFLEKRQKRQKHTTWTPEMIDYLKELTRLGLKSKVIRDTISNKFKVRLSTRKVEYKQYSLGLK